MKRKVMLLVTDDPDTATIATAAADALHHEVCRMPSGMAALSALMDDCGEYEFAVIDLERNEHNQAVYKTAAGKMPVIGISGTNHPGLLGVERHCHAAAHLQKPIQSDVAEAAFRRVALNSRRR